MTRGRDRRGQPSTVRSALRQDVARQLERAPSRWDVATSVLLYRGLQAAALYRIAHWCAQHRLRVVAEILVRTNQLLFTVDVAHQADIGPGLVLRHPSDIVIGRGCRVGADVTIFNGVTLGNRFSGSKDRPDGSPVIGDSVFIGSGAKILGPVDIGARSVIGANAVVTRSVPTDSTVVGNPAKVLGPRDASVPPRIEADRGITVQMDALRRRLDALEGRVTEP